MKSTIVAKGQKFSRQQINVSFPASLRFARANAKQALEIFGEAGIQAPTMHGFQEELNEVQTAILAEVKEQIEQNRAKVVQTVRNSPNFDPAIHVSTWHNANGQEHDTMKITAKIDAAGAMRSYLCCITGTQSAAALIANEIDLPIATKCSWTGCLPCTKAIHQAIRDSKKNTSLFLGKHKGECTCNSMNGPAVAEEFMMETVGRDLLVDTDGNYRGDDLALFVCFPTSDGDSKGANRLV
jgi:hypothetical protein